MTELMNASKKLRGFEIIAASNIIKCWKNQQHIGKETECHCNILIR